MSEYVDVHKLTGLWELLHNWAPGFGCCLHIALEDYNVSDDSLRFCEKYAEEQGHQACRHVAALFRELVPEERREAFLGVCVDDEGHVHHVPRWLGDDPLPLH